MIRDLAPTLAFCAVVEHRGLTRAAEMLGVPKSTLSRWLHELEARRGVKLLDRSSRRMVPTEAGRAFFARASEGLRGIRVALGEAADVGLLAGGTIRITATPDLGETVIAPILGRFARLHANVRIEALLTHDLIDLAAHRIDVAVRVGTLRDSSLIARRVGSTGRCVVASPGYLAHAKPRRPEDLRDHACMAQVATEGDVRWPFVRRGRRHTVTVTPRLVANSMRTLKTWALDGLGIAMLSRIVCADELRRGTLVPLLKSYVADEEPVSVVYASDRFMPARIRGFVDFLAGELTGALT